ncbi:hypothetical protein Cgig2_003891 [Carnegiea gigantea]|uniref:Myb-like domain-containing protein n=1 Tax=Carnegiea gigantea TaxID=171969 RepID=A0A9Q1JTR5_9CARY|nr:hypothetical protein Cgig2_003891 [Carnegiea gigantea]
MASSGRKSHNWTNKEDDKLFDVLIEQKAQGATQFEWFVVKALLQVQGIDRDGTQIRNHYNDIVKKLKVWEWLIGQTGVGVNPVTGAVIVTDYTWEKFLKDLAVDLEEHVGDSDEAEDDEHKEQTELSAGAENRSPPRTTQTNSRKRRSEGGSSGDRRRLREELDSEVHNAFALMRVSVEARLNPPSIYEKVLTKLREHPGVAAKGPNFIFTVMEYITREQDFEYFVVFNDDDITRYLRVRGLGDV